MSPLTQGIEPGEFVQILNKSESHWFTISTIGRRPGVANVYDSACKYITQRNREEIAALRTPAKIQCTITLQYKNAQHQNGVSNYGLCALVFATVLSWSTDLTACKFDPDQMRQHLLQCIKKGQIHSIPLKQTCHPVKADIYSLPFPNAR